MLLILYVCVRLGWARSLTDVLRAPALADQSTEQPGGAPTGEIAPPGATTASSKASASAGPAGSGNGERSGIFKAGRRI